MSLSSTPRSTSSEHSGLSRTSSRSLPSTPAGGRIRSRDGDLICSPRNLKRSKKKYTFDKQEQPFVDAFEDMMKVSLDASLF